VKCWLLPIVKLLKWILTSLECTWWQMEVLLILRYLESIGHLLLLLHRRGDRWRDL
jgi:hypothetical protein